MVEAFSQIDTVQIDPLASITKGHLTDDPKRPSRNSHQLDGRDRRRTAAPDGCAGRLRRTAAPDKTPWQNPGAWAAGL